MKGLSIFVPVDVYMATFGGRRIEHTELPLGKYIVNNTNPARVYYHT